ncbi:peptidoglycan-binding protein [Actinomyces israelii]
MRLRRRTRDAGGDLASLIESGEGAGDPAGAEAPERKGSAHPTRRRLLIGVGAALLLVGAGAGTAAAAGVLPGQARKNEDKPAEFTGTTEEITRGTLQGETSAAGTLRFSDSHVLRSGFEGVVTWLPAAGTVLHAGDQLYDVGGEPAYLMHGSIPAWRAFEDGMSKGSDVQQLQAALQSLGYFTREPDGTFGWWTMRAIRAWQKDKDLEQTGAIPLGRVVFAPDDLRVGSIKSRVGDKAAVEGDLYDVTSTAQVVDVNIKLADQQLGVVGNKVTLHLPGAVDTTGTISSVGTPTEKSGSGDSKEKERVIPVTITPDDASVTASFQEVSVTVGLPSEKRENVLSVPVGALVALSPEQFGVEVVQADNTTQRVPVTTGLFAAGRVEISGEGLAEGQRVVVPQR